MTRKTTWCMQFCHLSARQSAMSFYLHLGIQIKCKIPGSVKSRQVTRSNWVNLPHAEEFGLLPGGWRFGLHFQRVNVGDGDDSGSHVPRQAHERADYHQDGHPEQVQVIACPFLRRDTRKESEITPQVSCQNVIECFFNDFNEKLFTFYTTY